MKILSIWVVTLAVLLTTSVTCICPAAADEQSEPRVPVFYNLDCIA